MIFVLTSSIILFVYLSRKKLLALHKQQLEELKKSEQKFRNLFEHSIVGMVRSSYDGEKIFDANESFLAMYGVENLEEAKQFFIYVHQKYFERVFKKLISNGTIENIELEVLRKDGTPFWISFSARIYPNEGFIESVILDITATKNMEEDLRTAQKMEGVATLASGIAHDFNNFLGIIRGYASLSMLHIDDAEKLQKNLLAIENTVERGSVLVKQLLTFAQKASKKVEPINVNRIMNDVIKMIRETFPRTITGAAEFSDDDPHLLGDVTQMYQALLNLCINAKDAMVNNGVITMRSQQCRYQELQQRFPNAYEHNYVCISVSDTGSGISEETKKKIFDPFFTTKEKGKGTGLGLAVVYGIVNNFGGFVDVQSEIGKGTTFYLYFPYYELIQKPQEIITLPKVRPVHKNGKETIFFVEDEELMRDVVIKYLTESGYNVLTASDGIEGVQYYSEHFKEIALVVSDMGLPRMEGGRMFEKMKQINPDIKFIFASGYLEPKLKSDLIEKGAKDFIDKPYQLENINEKIRAVLDD